MKFRPVLPEPGRITGDLRPTAWCRTWSCWAKAWATGIPCRRWWSSGRSRESMSRKKYFNTYAFNPICCAAGRAVLRAIDEDGIRQNAKEVGAYLRRRMGELQEKYDVIAAVRGMGLHDGVELVKGPEDKRTRGRGGRIHHRVRQGQRCHHRQGRGPGQHVAAEPAHVHWQRGTLIL